jgi:hypothetical protein
VCVSGGGAGVALVPTTQVCPNQKKGGDDGGGGCWVYRGGGGGARGGVPRAMLQLTHTHTLSHMCLEQPPPGSSLSTTTAPASHTGIGETP